MVVVPLNYLAEVTNPSPVPVFRPHSEFTLVQLDFDSVIF